MVLFSIIIGVACVAAVVVGSLFYFLNQEIPAQEVKPIVPQDVQSNKISNDQGLAMDPRVFALQQELEELSRKALSQSQEARSMLTTLEGENQRLKEENERLKNIQDDANVKALEDRSKLLQQDNIVLQQQLDSSQVKLKDLQQEMDIVKQSMAKEIAVIEEDKKRLEREIEVLKETFTQDKDSSSDAVKAFEVERQALLESQEKLKADNQQFKMLNDELIKKQEILQTDLIKSRAKISSLERICHNYQDKLDELIKRIGSYEIIESQLKEMQLRLENDLKQTKEENDNISRREKLAQFELQKVRAQVVDLERLYESQKDKNIGGKMPQIKEYMVCLIAGVLLVGVLGCGHVLEAGKTVWGSSTRAVERARIDALTKTYDRDYWTVMKAVLAAIEFNEYEIFIKDEIRGHLVVMGIKGSVDTTEVGIFLVEVNEGQTRIEIASLSTNAKRIVSKAVFKHMDITFGLAKAEELPIDAMDKVSE